MSADRTPLHLLRRHLFSLPRQSRQYIETVRSSEALPVPSGKALTYKASNLQYDIHVSQAHLTSQFPTSNGSCSCKIIPLVESLHFSSLRRASNCSTKTQAPSLETSSMKNELCDQHHSSHYGGKKTMRGPPVILPCHQDIAYSNGDICRVRSVASGGRLRCLDISCMCIASALLLVLLQAD